MAEVRNVFIKSKMNKDLDERLLPPGEYRDGQNISVSKSEGPDEGVVENILGNALYSNFNFATGTEIIGVHVDTNRDRIFVFATNFSDGSPNQNVKIPSSVVTADGKVTDKANCYIAYIDGPLNSGSSSQNSDILVEGGFLNFSKSAPMLGMDMIEDLLFFTDNRNQPRKINVETAIAESATSTSPYYTNEDHISVAKYAPVEAMEFLDSSDNVGLLNQESKYLPPSVTVPVMKFTPGLDPDPTSTGASDFTVKTQIAMSGTFGPLAENKLRGINLNFPELGYFMFVELTADFKGNFCRIQYPIGSNNNPEDSMTAINDAAQKIKEDNGVEAFSVGDVLQWEYENPEYDPTFDGDKNYLKDKFVRFSYRFKYDDNEYSLMAPFTQHAFVPKRFGYFCDSSYEILDNDISLSNPDYSPATPLIDIVEHGNLKRDERDAAESGVVNFMENQVTTCKLKIPMPFIFEVDINAFNNRMGNVFLSSKLKVKSIQILIKESDGLAVKVVEEIDVNIENGFNSGGTKYYEYIYKSNKPFKTLPDSDTTRVHDKVPVLAAAQAVTSNRIVYGNYIEKLASPDFLDYDLGVNEKPDHTVSDIIKEYPNHTLKQNRSYKVGVVLMDRYGRSSNVILRRPNSSSASDLSSVYASYEDLASPLNWRGNNLDIVFKNTIPTAIVPGGYPGVYETKDPGGFNNPTGYLSYKIVVQQQEQEYYNVLTPGATSGVITFNGQIEEGSTNTEFNTPKYIRTNSTTNIALYGDNINKVPKELADVGPTEEIYGSSTLLYPRVVTKLIVNSSNDPAYVPAFATSQSSQVSSLSEFTVKSIFSFSDLGKWTETRNTPKTGALSIDSSNYPNSTSVQVVNTNILKNKFIDPIYLGASSNPFIAQLETSFLVGYNSGTQAPRRISGTTTNQVLPDFSKNLNVFETNPFVSKLEIFWETSTAGLIVELNKDIVTGTADIPNDISTINLQMNEALAVSSSSFVSDEFEVLDSAGGVIADGTCTMTVRDINNAPSNNFELIQPTPGVSKFRIRLIQEIAFLADDTIRNFNFTLTISTTSNPTTTKTLSRTLTVGNTNPFVLNPAAFVEATDPTGNGKRNILFEGQEGNPGVLSTDYGSRTNPWIVVEAMGGSSTAPTNLNRQIPILTSASTPFVMARWTVNSDFFNTSGFGTFVNGCATPSGNSSDQRSLQLNFTDETTANVLTYIYPGSTSGGALPPNLQTFGPNSTPLESGVTPAPLTSNFYEITPTSSSGGGFDLKLKNDWAYTTTEPFGPGFISVWKFMIKVTDANNNGGEVYYSAFFSVEQAASGFSGGCWVAREVYGINNSKWLLFRDYLFNESPNWFRNIYIKHGEKFANFISNKPLLKSIIKLWMNIKIKNK